MGIFNFLKKEKQVILDIEFPIFKGFKIMSKNGKTSKYERKDYYYRYNQEKVNDYIQQLNYYGFTQISDKKYVKGNSYLIVEKLDNRLHIAFQVNK